MDQLELIRITHEIDRHVAELSAAVSDEDLKKDLVAFNARWRELAYRVTANLCGLAPNGDATAPKRRGRRRRTDTAEEMTGAEDRGAGASS
jgi:hypothetical protein